MQSALVLCNGDPPQRSFVRRLTKKVDRVVAADGGANVAREIGIVPDLIIGDLDSMTSATRRHFRDVLTLHVARQDNTDLEKALEYLAAHGVRDVIVLGGIGRRIDFTIGNFSVLWKYRAFMCVRFAGDGWYAMAAAKKNIIHAHIGTVVSLIPFGPCDGITLRGLEYLLTNASMRIGDVGISNVVRSSPFKVSVQRGTMLLVVLEDLRPKPRERS
jgi:thiamine pyrophosphokinase